MEQQYNESMDTPTAIKIKQQIATLQAELAILLNSAVTTPSEQLIYTKAKVNIGEHLTLNSAIAGDVGCAEAVSKVLSLAGYNDGPQGIAGTAALYEWLVTNPKFVKIDAPEAGAIVVSPTGMGNGSVEGHTGICGKFGVAFSGDFGIMSNNSATGKFLETWSYDAWEAYYGVTGGLPVALFRAL